MKHNNRFINTSLLLPIIILLPVFCSIPCLADDEPSPDNLEIIEKLESSFKVKVFYREAWLEHERLNDFDPALGLASALDEVFDGTLLYYSIYQQNTVVLTKGDPLDASLLSRAMFDEPEAEMLDTLDRDAAMENLREQANQIHQIGIPGKAGETAVLSGKITGLYSSQQLPGTSVYIEGENRGTIADGDGTYRIELTTGYHEIRFTHVGMKPAVRKIQLYSEGDLDVQLQQETTSLKQVFITAESVKKEREHIGFEKLESEKITELPSFMGEADIIKHSLLLPGIQSTGEGDMRFNVRGGKNDQNLVLLDGMHSYSNSHFFGFFPGISAGLVKDAEFYKAGMPLQYGGRISSVYNITLDPGNTNELSLHGGVSPVSLNLAVKGPLMEDRLSFSAGARKTYSNWVMDLFSVKELTHSSMSFHDYQMKLSWRDNDKLSISGFFYQSYDDFVLHQDSSYTFTNQLASLNVNYHLSSQTAFHATLGYTRYNTSRTQRPSRFLAARFEQAIEDYKFSASLTHQIHPNHEILGGINLLRNTIDPWSREKDSEQSIVKPVKLNRDKALQGAIYLGDHMQLTPRFKLKAGIRFNMYALLGRETLYEFSDDRIHMDYLEDTHTYDEHKLAYFDGGPEYRISGSYQLVNHQYLNFGYDHNRQYIHLLTNTQAASPVDSWQLSNENIPPQVGDHLSIGYKNDIRRGRYIASLDLYYKSIRNIKDFIDGSQFELNPHPETEIVNARSQSYGLEMILKKKKGRLTGWIAYTLSKAKIKAQSRVAEKNINNGAYYPASFDKPHNLSMVINYEPTRRLMISNVVRFSSGIPMTLPVAKASLPGSQREVLFYSRRNEYRIPHYFRYDISLTYRGTLKKDPLWQSEWAFSLYNVTGRRNPYSIFYKKSQSGFRGYQLSIFGEPIPTITYQFKF